MKAIAMKLMGVVMFTIGVFNAAAMLIWAFDASGAQSDVANAGFVPAVWMLLVRAVVAAFFIVFGWHLIKYSLDRVSIQIKKN